MAPSHIFQNEQPFPKANEGFAAWSVPREKQVMLMTGPVGLMPISDLGQRGFVVAPFVAQNKAWFIHPRHHYKFSGHDLPSSATEFTFYFNDEDPKTDADAVLFRDMVKQALAAFRVDGLQKVVLSRTEKWPLPLGFKPWKFFLQLTELYPDAFVALVSLPEFGTWIGASPELLLNVAPGEIETMALAGTKPLEKAYSFTAKERREQQMVVDYISHKLQKEQLQFTISSAEIATAGNICHLRSRIVSPDTGKWQSVLKTLHPTPAICGTPTQAALYYILKHENYKRSLYGGFWGPIFEKNKATFYVNLRTMQVKTGLAELYAGVGIVKGSNPQNEWDETVAKMQTLKKALQQYE